MVGKVPDTLFSLRSLGLGNSEHSLRKSAYEQLNSTLELLNQSLGTCLR
jgi:hypothetical protein